MREERLPLPSPQSMTDVQRAAAERLSAGPRKGVKGPFVALLRSPELLTRLEPVGDYLRFRGVLPPRLSELATLIVARAWSQQFEWVMHVPLALKAGISRETVEALREGRRPPSMSAEEASVHEFVSELLQSKGVSQATYDAAIARYGDQGVVELIGIVGYFTTMCMLLNVARTPAEATAGIDELPALPY